MKKTKEEAKITFNNILMAGLKIFSRKGYNATTLEEVAKEASVTRGAVYWHFKNKYELYVSLVNKYGAKIYDRLNGVKNSKDTSINKIKNIIKAYFESLEDDEEFRLIETICLRSLNAVYESSDFYNEQIIILNELSEIVSDLINKAKSETGASDINVEVVTKMLVGMIIGTESLWLLMPYSFSIKKEADVIADSFVRIFKK